jgi:hypothetical protein
MLNDIFISVPTHSILAFHSVLIIFFLFTRKKYVSVGNRKEMVHNIDLFCNHSDSIDFKINFADIRKNVSSFDEDVLDASFVIVWETAVSPLSKTERMIFFVLTTIICTVAYLGNVLVLYVNFTR